MPQADRVPLIAALRALSTVEIADGDIFFVQGYSSRRDGGEGWFEYDASSSRSDNNGTVIAPSDGTGRWFRHHTDGEVNLRWFGAKGDGANNDYKAFRDAIDSFAPVGTPNHGTAATYGGTIIVPRSEKYYVVDPVAAGAGDYLDIDRCVHLKGQNFGSPFCGTAIQFKNGGIRVVAANDVLANPRGDHSIFENIWFRGNDQLYHGVLVQARCHFVNVRVQGWGWDGVLIDGVNQATLIRNANNSTAWNLYSENNGGWGFQVRGSDANAGMFHMVGCSGNGMGGIRSSPFLNATFVAPFNEATIGHSVAELNSNGEYRYPSGHPNEGEKIDLTAQIGINGEEILKESDVKRKYAFKLDGTANRTVMIGAYTEADSRLIQLDTLSIILGVTVSGGYDQIEPVDSANMGLAIVDGQNISPFVVRSGVAGVGRRVPISIGSRNGRTILGWQVREDPSGQTDAQAWRLNVRPEENGRTILAAEGLPGVGDAQVALEIPDVGLVGQVKLPQGLVLEGVRIYLVASKPKNDQGSEGDLAFSTGKDSLIGWKKRSGTWIDIQ